MTPGVRHLLFLDLPREIRDKIYEYSREFSWIDITNMPEKLPQPAVSKVSHQIRDEALDIFYGRNRFMLDCRNHIHPSYSSLTPAQIFNRWITAIGDSNTKRLRTLIFYVYNFAVHLTVLPPSPNQPTAINLRFRKTKPGLLDVADDAPSGYTARIAVERAEAYLQHSIEQLLSEVEGRALRVEDVKRLGEFVEAVKPALCTRNGVGWKGSVLGEDVREAPRVEKHLAACAECRYVFRTGI